MTRNMLITGASRGIGAAIAARAAANGYAVIVNYASAASRAEALVEEIRLAGGTAHALRADISKPSEVEMLFEKATEAIGPLDCVVNNAGIGLQQRVRDFSSATVEQIFSINTFGTMFSCKEAVRRMSTSEGGRGGVIVNIGSISSLYGGFPSETIYAASKGAIDAFTLALAKEVARQGIRVCGIRPGIIATELFEADFGAGAEERAGSVGVPMGRVGEAAEIADAVLFLASDAASYITGAWLNVSGGRELNVQTAATTDPHGNH